MRIYMITSVLAAAGGIEAALVSLTRELKSLGHETRVYVIWQPAHPNQNLAALEQMTTQYKEAVKNAEEGASDLPVLLGSKLDQFIRDFPEPV